MEWVKRAMLIGMEVASLEWDRGEVGAKKSSDVLETKSITTWFSILVAWWIGFTSVGEGGLEANA